MLIPAGRRRFSVMGDADSEGEAPRCVGCGRRVKTLFVQYSPGNIRLMKCDNCKAVADPYIECGFMIILIDLILHKTRAYRHLQFNKLHIGSSLDKGLLLCSAGRAVPLLQLWLVRGLWHLLLMHQPMLHAVLEMFVWLHMLLPQLKILVCLPLYQLHAPSWHLMKLLLIWTPLDEGLDEIKKASKPEGEGY